MFAEVINYILGLGAAVFLPVVMIILGMILRMRLKTAISAGLTLGVAFTGIGVVLTFMMNSIGPASRAFVENTGLKLIALDVGWSPLAAISWAWPYAFFMFPLQIGINIVMLFFGWTNCLNVDMWNVWNKIMTAVVVAYVSGSLPLAFLVAAFQIVMELKNADLLQKQTFRVTGIPGIALTHPHALVGIFIAPVNRLLDYIPGLGKTKLDAETLREKIGLFGENHIMGFIVGTLIAIAAGYNFKATVTLAIQAGTALTIFPMVAQLFMRALAPFSDAASDFMKARFPGRSFYIGLDWPFLAGHPELWVTVILLVPFVLGLAVILPGNALLPFGGILMTGLCFTTLILTNKDIVRMFILGVIFTPLYLYAGSVMAPAITDLGRTVNAVEIPAGQLITRMGIEAPGFRLISMEAAKLMKGEYLGLLLVAIYIVLIFWYFKEMRRKEAEAAKESGLDEAQENTANL